MKTALAEDSGKMNCQEEEVIVVIDSKVAKDYKSLIRIALPSNEHAIMIVSCLEVDEELQPNRISKSFDIDDKILTM
jgi:hypothetical protein